MLICEHTECRGEEMECVFGLVGVGGFAREVMPLVPYSLRRTLEPKAANVRLVYVQTQVEQPEVNGLPVMSEAEFLALDAERYFNVAIADAATRKAVAERFLPHAQPLTLIAENHVNLGYNQVGEGAILCPFSTITANARIGRFFHANLYAYVAHDCVIGDFVTFAPNVHCNGNVHIEDDAYIGTGAIIRQGTESQPLLIGKAAIIGMGAVVTKPVSSGVTVVGNPARPLEKK